MSGSGSLFVSANAGIAGKTFDLSARQGAFCAPAQGIILEAGDVSAGIGLRDQIAQGLVIVVRGDCVGAAVQGHRGQEAPVIAGVSLFTTASSRSSMRLPKPS